MNKKSLKFKLVDALYLCIAIAPIIVGMVIQILTKPSSAGEINITGAGIYFEIKMPIQNLPITEAQVNSWLVVITIFGLCLYLSHGISAKCECKRQHLAEMIVEKTENLVKENMGEYFMGFAPFIGAVLGLSAFSSLLSLFGLFAPTSDLSVITGWSILVFILITYYKMKCGFPRYLKSFTEPVAFMTPLNIVSEIATPISMTLRHYGNIFCGSVVSILLAYALGTASNAVFGRLPGFLGSFPFLRIGLPAVLSVYFDIFSGCIQAFIFSMLTMSYISSAFDMETYERRREKKMQKKLKKSKSKA